jgi:hypothetical protein
VELIQLCTLPGWALFHIFSQPELVLKDLAALQRTCSPLCAAARDSKLPQWQRVRVLGPPPLFQNKVTFKDLKALVGPNPNSRHLTPQELFTDAQWEAAIEHDPSLKIERIWCMDGRASRLNAEIKARWESLDEVGVSTSGMSMKPRPSSQTAPHTQRPPLWRVPLIARSSMHCCSAARTFTH